MDSCDLVTRGDHHRISPTARAVAYCRSFTDIPLAVRTSRALRGEQAARDLCGEDVLLAARLTAPYFEARYKCFNRFIARHAKVFELAMGCSIERGLSISDDTDKIYVGTDLPEVIAASRSLIDSIGAEARSNHYLKSANILLEGELREAAQYFGSAADLLIINEGVWGYLTLEEQMVGAENIRQILVTYGGIWVTPDIVDLESQEKFTASLRPEHRSAFNRISNRSEQITGRIFKKNLLPTRRDAVRFLQTAGFEVNHYPLVEDLRELSSLESMWGERVTAVLGPGLKEQLVWEMSAR